MKRSFNRAGFTLVETLVSTAIFAFLIMVLYGVFRTGTSVYLTDGMLLDLQQQARNSMDRIVREVRQSNSSSIAVVSDDSDILTFSTPVKANIQYYREGTRLVREYPLGMKQVIATDIAHLKFTKTGAQLVIVIQARKMDYWRMGPADFSLAEFQNGKNPDILLSAISVSNLPVPNTGSAIDNLNSLLVDGVFHKALMDKIEMMFLLLPDGLTIEDLQIQRKEKNATLFVPGEVRSILEVNYPQLVPTRQRAFEFSLTEEIQLRNE